MVAPGFIAIGSGPAGLTAAETFGRKHPKIPVHILSSDPALPYAKPHLSKAYLRGRYPKLDLHSPGWFVQNGIRLHSGITVDHIDVVNREVVTAAGRRYRYWHLVLACGATPVPLAVPGGETAQPLRSFSDAVVLRMAAKNAESAIVIGGGLIGCEAASSLASCGIATSLVAPEPVPLHRRFGLEVGERVAKMLSDNGVRFIGSTGVAAVEDRCVTLNSGEAVEAELVVSAVGVRPDGRLAAAAGIDTECGRVVVDEHMHTSAVNVYAAGDVALAYNVTAGRRVPAEHWRDAARQGRIAGLVAAGYQAVWDAVPEFSFAIGDQMLKYRGWGTEFEHSRVVDHRDGFTAWYEIEGETVGVLSSNA
ncbi:NAD(P)/FAD-dependent oxidoreductase [Mycolicibacterium stellerae]|uniref:NAD(P)/FAD-dependent oxidoreductase n=1 Tax=Mycolicibacterium stellerae TaxID=2358193 RepID=UPI000F0BD8EA|nr:FAD/NAD(P)-binding oxidoreductase [Mycolicibacterium stellerae]